MAKGPMVDRSGISTLIHVYKLVEEGGGRLRIFAAPSMVKETLTMVGLHTLVAFYEDEANALASD